MGLVPARCPGWLLEGRGNPSPRGMAAQSRFPKRDGQNPAYRPSGVFIDSVARNPGGRTLNCEKLWLDRRDPTTGASRDGVPTATRDVLRPGFACATAKAAARSATSPRPKRRTAASAGISVKPTPPNTTGTGTISLD